MRASARSSPTRSSRSSSNISRAENSSPNMSRWYCPRPTRSSTRPPADLRTMRRLYTFFRSSTSYRLRIALALKGLDWEPHYVSLPRMEHRAADYMALNPQGLVPALIEDDGAVLAQSLAIIEYLDEKYPDPPLLPGSPTERAYVRSLTEIVGCDIHPLNNTRVLKWLASRWRLSEADVNEW